MQFTEHLLTWLDCLVRRVFLQEAHIKHCRTFYSFLFSDERPAPRPPLSILSDQQHRQVTTWTDKRLTGIPDRIQLALHVAGISRDRNDYILGRHHNDETGHPLPRYDFLVLVMNGLIELIYLVLAGGAVEELPRLS